MGGPSASYSNLYFSVCLYVHWRPVLEFCKAFQLKIAWDVRPLSLSLSLLTLQLECVCVYMCLPFAAD